MIIKIVVLAIAVTLLSMLLKSDFKSGATLLTVAGCVLIFSASIDIFSKIGDSFNKMQISGSVNAECMKIIIKMLAVSYVTSFGADICSDAGEKALANAVESIGKLMMLAMAFPMLTAIFESIADMIG